MNRPFYPFSAMPAFNYFFFWATLPLSSSTFYYETDDRKCEITLGGWHCGLRLFKLGRPLYKEFSSLLIYCTSCIVLFFRILSICTMSSSLIYTYYPLSSLPITILTHYALLLWTYCSSTSFTWWLPNSLLTQCLSWTRARPHMKPLCKPTQVTQGLMSSLASCMALCNNESQWKKYSHSGDLEINIGYGMNNYINISLFCKRFFL